MDRKKKLLLINPIKPHKRRAAEDIRTLTPPLALGMLAALTPDDWDISIIDENFDDFEFEEADIVGITSLTFSINRAYEIASVYKEHAIPVVMGGIHVSMVPEEAEKYSDTIVIGEAESVWNTVLNDFLRGNLKPRYYGHQLPMDKIPAPRRDLFHKSYSYSSIQTTRGCPMMCDFCSTHTFNGRNYRQKPIDMVLDELETIEHDQLYIIDDNLIGHSNQATQRAISLFKGIVERGIKKNWYCQVSLNIAENDEVLEWASKSGCSMFLIGIESEKEEQLKEIHKNLNLKMGVNKYEQHFNKIHKYGISIMGTLIYGYDNDTIEDLFERTKFAIESGLDGMQASVLTPAPGTDLYKKLLKENRLIRTNYPEDWQYYHFAEVVFKPINMSVDELTRAMEDNWKIMYDEKVLYRKMLRTLKDTRNTMATISAYMSNVQRHNTCYRDSKKPLDPYAMLKGIPNIGNS